MIWQRRHAQAKPRQKRAFIDAKRCVVMIVAAPLLGGSAAGIECVRPLPVWQAGDGHLFKRADGQRWNILPAFELPRFVLAAAKLPVDRHRVQLQRVKIEGDSVEMVLQIGIVRRASAAQGNEIPDSPGD